MQKEIKKQKGFTIIELIVVMAIFLFIIGAALSVFVSIVRQQKRILSEQQLINQISYVEEYMSKALRMAKIDTDGSCLGTPGYVYLLTHHDLPTGTYRGIKFLNQTGTGDNPIPICQEFFLDNCDPDTNDQVLCEIKDDGTPMPITPSTLQFDSSNPLTFAINRSKDNLVATSGDYVQPRVTIIMNVKIAGDISEPIRSIQTTVSQRNLNAQP